MSNGTTAAFHTRRKEDGSGHSLCLGCFKTIAAPEDQAHEAAEQDHVCAFTFPGRRATEQDLDNGLRRRASDHHWQILISSQEAMGVAA